ncbi:MAG TPA: hypothetical protein DEF47_23365 [Herpetosiphon sp.]|uniref:Uncharacterized protein n=1 Tax=Herpetosiphon aurantiacus (strain ATCC 23779 / DSM 785 / 114-95) TaxID=316274 RepID=A9AX99_HERA2|nr:hypothetical protein [Herpetosiphon sp.]ABX06819.1 hypothetical protein Haur_4187 [Herpetosiphon aurantiacus DSM 785]HBW52832.1 hypothetical protein [Herpetosiphon sp.]
MRKKVARALFNDQPVEQSTPPKLISFGSNRSDQCTLYDAPAKFEQCLGCEYRRGSKGLGILCGHRFGLDPTYINGVLTQIQDDEIRPL